MAIGYVICHNDLVALGEADAVVVINAQHLADRKDIAERLHLGGFQIKYRNLLFPTAFPKRVRQQLLPPALPVIIRSLEGLLNKLNIHYFASQATSRKKLESVTPSENPRHFLQPDC